MATMRAVVAEAYGPPDSLAVAEVPVPRPGPGQVQVRVRAAALNPADLRTLSGAYGEWVSLTFPHVPGSDLAGVVTELGAGVTRFGVGDEVFGLGLPRAAAGMAALVSDPPSLTTGTMARYAVIEADTPALTRRPADLAVEQAAALPMAGLTALALLRAGRFRPDETVLTAARPGDLEQLAAWAADGTLPALVSRRYHLEHGARAYLDLVTDHTRGKLVVVMDRS